MRAAICTATCRSTHFRQLGAALVAAGLTQIDVRVRKGSQVDDVLVALRWGQISLESEADSVHLLHAFRLVKVRL